MGKSVKLLLDNIIFFLQDAGGGSVYWGETISRLDKHPDLDITYLSPGRTSENIVYKNLRDELGHPVVKEKGNPKFLSFKRSSHQVADRFVFHSSYYRTSDAKGSINIVTIHDFMPEIYFKGAKRLVHCTRKKLAILNADGIVCVSNHTRSDLMRFYPKVKEEKVVTIPLGISAEYKRLDVTDQRTPHQANDIPFVLFVGRRSYYKNFEFAVRVLAALKDYTFVVVGEPLSWNEHKMIEPIRHRFSLITHPTNEVLNRLYNGAHCLLYPSSYEGFGIPVVEAMSAGCPVVALDSSSITEIAGGFGLLAKNLNESEFVRNIERLADISYRKAIVEAGLRHARTFTWERSVSSLVDFYKKSYQETQ